MATAQDYVFWALSAVAVKLETTMGADIIGGTPLAADFLGAEATMRLPQQTAEDPSMNGSFDANAPIPTGIKPEITLRVPLRGAGTAGTAPEVGKLMRACRYAETLTAAAIGAPTAATAGSSSSLTLPATPFSSIADIYRGMPIELSGNPAVAIVQPVMGYTAARVVSLARSAGTVLNTSTLARILPNALYTPTSDDALLRAVTIYGYRNGLRYRVIGCVGSVRLEMTAGQPAFLVFTMRGLLVDAFQAVAMPTGWNAIRAQPPVWRDGLARLDKTLCNCQRFNFDGGVELADPDNPEAAQGFDNPMIVGAQQRIEIDPYANTTRSPTRFTKYQQGDSVEFAAMIGGTTGNRASIVLHSGIITSMDESNRGKLGVDQMQVTPNVPNNGVSLAFH